VLANDGEVSPSRVKSRRQAMEVDPGRERPNFAALAATFPCGSNCTIRTLFGSRQLRWEYS